MTWAVHNSLILFDQFIYHIINCGEINCHFLRQQSPVLELQRIAIIVVAAAARILVVTRPVRKCAACQFLPRAIAIQLHRCVIVLAVLMNGAVIDTGVVTGIVLDAVVVIARVIVLVGTTALRPQRVCTENRIGIGCRQ